MARFNIEAMDRRMKVWLLLSSAVVLALLVVAALQENIFPEWREYRTEYGDILRAKADDDRTRQLAADYEIGIDQIVVKIPANTPLVDMS